MQIDYQRCYSALNLELGADWQEAQASYRRLVHEWHPDRHTATPAQSQHAKSYFIELTSAYDAIRKYHRRYKRMPLLRNADTAGQVSNGQFSHNESLLNKARNRELNQRIARRRDFKKMAIPLLGIGFGLGVLVFLFSLDRQLAVNASDEAKRELEKTQPSRFQKSSSEVSRAKAKGAYIDNDPASGALEQGGELFPQE